MEKKLRIAIVGNSPNVIGKGRGNEIDSHDIVVRFNNFVLEGNEVDLGKKTTHIMLALSVVNDSGGKTYKNLDLFCSLDKNGRIIRDNAKNFSEIFDNRITKEDVTIFDISIGKEMMSKHRTFNDYSSGLQLMQYFYDNYSEADIDAYGFSFFKEKKIHAYDDEVVRWHDGKEEEIYFKKYLSEKIRLVDAVDEKHDDVLVTIFNYRHDENAHRLLSEFSKDFETIVLDSGNDKVITDFKQYPNIYYSGLFNEAKRIFSEGKYKLLVIICSDVYIDDDNFCKLRKKIIWLKSQDKIGVYQPSADSSSKSWLGFNTPNAGIVEHKLVEGWFQVIKGDIINRQPYVINNKYGWGIDNVTCFISNEIFKYKNVRDNDIIVHHEKGTGYDESYAKKEGPIYVSKTINEIKKNM